MITRTRWGRRPDGSLHAASVWYEPAPNGIEVPGHPGTWRVVAATVLPEDAVPVDEAVAVPEVTAIKASADQRIRDARGQHSARSTRDTDELRKLGLSPELAARIAARLGA